MTRRHITEGGRDSRGQRSHVSMREIHYGGSCGIEMFMQKPDLLCNSCLALVSYKPYFTYLAYSAHHPIFHVLKEGGLRWQRTNAGTTTPSLKTAPWDWTSEIMMVIMMMMVMAWAMKLLLMMRKTLRMIQPGACSDGAVRHVTTIVIFLLLCAHLLRLLSNFSYTTRLQSNGTAGDKFEADMDASWVTMRMISHFISVTQPDLEEFLLSQMDNYFVDNSVASVREESKGNAYTSQQYEIYQKYCSIFEESMCDFSDEHSKTEIVQTLKASNQSAESGRETMGTILLDMLEALSDFREFHLMYVEKRQEIEYPSNSSESKK